MARATTALLVTVVLGSACVSGTEPELASDRFALADVDGDGLPARVGDETWLADTLRFLAGGTWTRVEVVRLHGEGAPADPVRRESEGFVTHVGDRLVLDFECDPLALALCVAPDTLRVRGETLVRHPNRYGADTEWAPEFRYAPIGFRMPTDP